MNGKVWQSTQLDFLYVERCTVKSSIATYKVSSYISKLQSYGFLKLLELDTDSDSQTRNRAVRVRSIRNATPFRSSEWKRLNVWQSIQLDFLYVERAQ